MDNSEERLKTPSNEQREQRSEKQSKRLVLGQEGVGGSSESGERIKLHCQIDANKKADSSSEFKADTTIQEEDKENCILILVVPCLIHLLLLPSYCILSNPMGARIDRKSVV